MDLQTKVSTARNAGYSDAQINEYLSKNNMLPKKKVGGLTGAVLNALPIATGAAGTVLGSIAGSVVPGAGNVAGAVGGGALGSGFGEFLRQKLSGEDANVGSIAREGAFGALGGVGRGVQAARAAKGAVAGGKALQTTEAAMQARKGIVGKVKNNAQQASQEGFGVTVGQNAGRGRALTPDKADELQDFITNRSQQYGGIKAGKPIDQARDAQNVYNNVTKSLDDTLTKIDRPLQVQEPASVVARALELAKDSAAITKATPTLEKFKSKIEKAKSLKELEAIRREADNIAFTSTGAGKTSAAAQSHAVREAIDEFITPLSDDYKAIKGDYSLARDALESTSKASKNAKGFTLPFIGTEIGKQAVPGVKNKVAAKLSSAGAPPPPSGVPSFRPFLGQAAKAAIPQTATRAVGSAVFGTPFVGTGQAQEEVPQINAGIDPPEQPPAEQPQANPMFDPANVQTAVQRILANNGSVKDAAEYVGLVESLQKMSGEGGASNIKKTETQRARDEAAALTDTALGMLEQGSISTGLLGANVEKVKGMFSAGDQETIDFNNVVSNLRATIAKARGGSSFTETEKAMLNQYTPKVGDSGQELRSKMLNLQQIYKAAQEREYGVQYTEPAAAQVPA